MIRWLIRSLILALTVAGAMIIYLSPSLRSKTQNWLVDQKELIEKRITQTRKLLKKSGEKNLKRAQTELEQKRKELEKKSQKEVKELTSPSLNPPMEKPIRDKDKKELEKILEEHSE